MMSLHLYFRAIQDHDNSVLLRMSRVNRRRKTATDTEISTWNDAVWIRSSMSFSLLRRTVARGDESA